MRLSSIAACAASITVFFCAYAQTQSAPQQPPDPARIKVYQVGRHVKEPELLPIDFSNSIATACSEKISGTAVVAMIVDPAGVPRNIMLFKPTGNSLDRLAIVIAKKDRFKPGERDGVSVPISLTLKMKLEGCIVAPAGDGNTTAKARLRLQPNQQIGPASDTEPDTLALDAPSSATIPVGGQASVSKIEKSVSAPIPILTPEAKYTDEARRNKVQGVCLVSLIVDAYGMPQNPRIVRAIGYGLDEAALEAVEGYRFRPAMKADKPLPVMMTIQVNFKLR
jgi:TonB family protein